MNGFDDTDAALLERAGTALAVLFLGGAAVCLVGWLLAGCTPRAQTAAEVAAYGAELEACAVQASTCPGYVACRQRAAARYGRAYSGRCAP
jgi:hypothetical protein